MNILQILLRYAKHIYQYIILFITNCHHFDNSSRMQFHVDCLFVDHNFGGGTEQFRRNYFSSHNSLIYYRLINVSTNLRDVFYQIVDNNNVIVLKFTKIERLFQRVSTKSIIINSLVGYEKPEVILDLCTKERQDCGTNLVFFHHDYFAICPSYNLVGGKKSFCKKECIETSCVCVNPRTKRKVNISYWRQKFLYAMQLANENIFFSRSSFEIFKEIMGDGISTNYVISPHDMTYYTYTSISNIDFTKPRIAIIGNINSNAKGIDVVRRIVNIEKNQFDIERLLLIGDIADKRIRIEKTGAYKNSELKEILVRYGINIALVPSIWPETFSYLTSELIKLNIPLACFNLGAQGEKVALYEYGMVINIDEKNIIAQLLNHYKRMKKEWKNS